MIGRILCSMGLHSPEEIEKGNLLTRVKSRTCKRCKRLLSVRFVTTMRPMPKMSPEDKAKLDEHFANAVGKHIKDQGEAMRDIMQKYEYVQLGVKVDGK